MVCVVWRWREDSVCRGGMLRGVIELEDQPEQEEREGRMAIRHGR